MSKQIDSIAGMSANDIRAAMGTRPTAKSKAHVASLVKARLDATVNGGRIPKQPSLKLYAELAGVEYEWDRGEQRTHKQIRKGTATLNERRKTAAAKPKRKARRKPAAQKPSASGLSIEDLVAEHGADEVLAAFTKFIAQSSK